MNNRHRFSNVMLFLSLFLSLGTVLAACGGSATSVSSSSATATTSPSQTQNVSIGLGYIPDIQFAPFYVAQSKGYYKNVGLNVTFHHGIVPDLIGSMVAGKNTFVFAGGDELLEAMSKNSSVKAVYAGDIFQQYPVSLIVPANSPIKTLADLPGHTIGVPGLYGSTYTGLLALLYKADLSPASVKIQSIGFSQVAALLTHKVDAVMGYSNNEPLQLQAHGFAVRTFNVSDYQPLISNGIITTSSTLQSSPQLVCSFVQATLKGVKEVIANPAEAITIGQNYIPGMNVTQSTAELTATIPVWQASNGKFGYSDPAIWSSMSQFLVTQQLISAVPHLSSLYTNQCAG